MLSDILIRLQSLLRRKKVETELDDELRFHFERQVAKHVNSGMPPTAAEKRARLEMGGIEQLKEECRDARGVSFIETLAQDVRYGLRVLRRTPVVTVVAVLSLALGIGANTAIFSLINTVMLRALPVQHPDQLVTLSMGDPERRGQINTVFTNPLWEQLRDQQDIFSGMVVWSLHGQTDIAQGGTIRPVNSMFVNGDYFRTLGVRPALGRLLDSSDDRRGCPELAVVSYGFWQDHFGQSRNAIGSTISLENHPFEVIGVSGAGFYGVEVGKQFDIAVPICASVVFDEQKSRLDHRSYWWLEVLGRRKPEVTTEAANARLAVLSPAIFKRALPVAWKKDAQDNFVKNKLSAAPAATGISYLRNQYERPLTILMVVVGLVLLIACANIASLMLARAATRNKEIAVRKALGASRGRLIRQLLTECILLSAAGARLGVLFARWGTMVLVHFLSTSKNQVFLTFPVDMRVLAFTIAVALLTGILFGLFPALRSTKVSLTSAMKGSQAESTERCLKFRAGKWIVAAQVALSLVLLVTAGLFLRSFAKLRQLDIGFDRSNVLIVATDLKTGKVPEANRLAVYEAIEQKLRALPGVISAGRSLMTPISHYVWNEIIIVDDPSAPKGDDALAYLNFVSPKYLETMRIPLLAGRAFDEHDVQGAPDVAIVNETFARRFFPATTAIGKVYKMEGAPGSVSKAIRIVGMMRDTKYEELQEATLPQAVQPIAQQKEETGSQNFLLRTAVPPSTLASAVEEAIGEVNKSIPLDFQTLSQQVDDSMSRERLLATLSGFFGGLALLLAMIGLYGALSYLVTQRQPEFGIRMALGAEPNSILRLVMKDLLFVLGGGILSGTALSLATVGLLGKLLFGLAPRDTFTLALAVGVLSVVALVAGYFPARRAMRLDPVVALRYE